MSRLRGRLRDERGFTLIELLVSMMVLGVLFAAFALVVGTTMRESGELEDNSVLQTQVRAGVDQLGRELRQMSYGDGTTMPIESFSASAIQFLMPDKGTPYYEQRIGYQVSSGALQRRLAKSTTTSGPPWTFGSLSAWRTVADRLTTSSIFTYYDATGAVTATLANITTIKVTVTVATKTSPNRKYTYSISVTPRAY